MEINNEQQSFCQNRSTADTIFTLRQILKKSMCFTDIKLKVWPRGTELEFHLTFQYKL